MPPVKNRTTIDFSESFVTTNVTLLPPGEVDPIDQTGPDLGQVLLPKLRRWWFLLVVPVICGILGFYIVQHDTPYYQGRMLMGVGPSAKEVKVGVAELVNLRLTASYIQLASSNRFLELVVQQSNSKMDQVNLRQSIVASALKNTVYFEFQFVGTDPAEVLKVLGAIRDLLVDESPQLRELRSQAQQDFLVNRRQELLTLIEERTQELNTLVNAPALAAAAGDGSTVRSASLVRSELDSYNQELTELNQFTTTNVPNQLHVVENPHLLSVRLGAQPGDGAIAMAAISLALVIILLLLVEKWDPRLRYSYQVNQLLQRNVLLATGPGKKSAGRPLDMLAAELVVRANSSSPKDRSIYRLLCLAEDHTKNATLNISGLAETLVSLGINCTVRNGLSGELKFFSKAGNGEASPGLRKMSPHSFKGNWELIELKWPASLATAGNLAWQADEVVVLCSLNNSYKESLHKLKVFFDKVSCKIAGVVLI